MATAIHPVLKSLQDQVNAGDITSAQANAAWQNWLAKSGSGTAYGSGGSVPSYQMGYGNTGLGGYASAMPGNNPVGLNPYELNAVTQQAGILGGMYASDNQLAGNNYSADRALQGVDMQTLRNLLGVQDTNRTNLAGIDMTSGRNLLGIQDTNKTNLGITGLQTDAQRYGYDQNLAGVKDTNLANQNIAQTNITPAMYKTDTLRDLLGLGGSTTGSGSLGGGLGGLGSGGTGSINLGGGTGTGANTSTTGAAYPTMPVFRTFDDIALQRKMGAANADISQAYDAQNKQLTNSLAGRGFSTNSPGFQSLLANSNAQKLGAIQDSNRELQNTSMQYNAQNALPYAKAQMDMYNADQDRLNRLQLARTLNPGTIISALA